MTTESDYGREQREQDEMYEAEEKHAMEQACEVFAAEAGVELTQTIRTFVAALQTMSTTLQRVYERACNGYRSDVVRGVDAHTEKLVLARAEQGLRAFGMTMYVNSDPRGRALGFHTPKTGRYNTMGGREDGWRV
jgi:hypothetical protein